MSLFLALLLVPQETPPEPRQEEGELRGRIRELERRLPGVEEELQKALDEEDLDEVARLNRERLELQRELEGLREEIESRRFPWYRRLHLEGEALLTHWDNDLEIHDGVGWGAAVHAAGFLSFEYRRWEQDDELRGGDATVQSYQLGLVHRFKLSEERRTALRISGHVGLIHFDGDGPGGDADSGPVLSITPQFKHFVSERVRLNVGGEADLLRTDFNQNHHHTNHNFSLLASIELAF